MSRSFDLPTNSNLNNQSDCNKKKKLKKKKNTRSSTCVFLTQSCSQDIQTSVEGCFRMWKENYTCYECSEMICQQMQQVKQNVLLFGQQTTSTTASQCGSHAYGALDTLLTWPLINSYSWFCFFLPIVTKMYLNILKGGCIF